MQLAFTKIKDEYAISTMYRESSAMVQDCWYFETCVFTLNEEGLYGKMLLQESSGIVEIVALDRHLEICKEALEGKHDE